MDFNTFNPFSSRFLETRNKSEVEREEQMKRNSQGYSAEEVDVWEMGLQTQSGSYGVPEGGFVTTQAVFKQIFNDKVQRVQMYRNMAYFPEIHESIETICDEAICEDKHGNFMNLVLRKEIPAREEAYIKKTFDYLLHDVFKMKDNGWEFFRRWLVDGELFLEFILNDKKTKIIGIKPLPSHTTHPIYEGSNIVKFCQSVRGKGNKKTDTYFEPDQVAYSNWGQYGSSMVDVRGFLEGSIRTYNQLKNLEDAVIVYRLVRAPERRLWNVEVGRLTTGKAEEHLKRLVAKYRKNNIYNSTTGHIDSAANMQALTEDYWFAKKEGQGTEVQLLQSGLNLGELDDVKYFLTKLYKTLKIPKSRYEDTLGSVTSNVTPGEITREELKFSKFIERCRRRFKSIFLDALTTQLRISQKVHSKYTVRSLFDIEFLESNDFAESKKLAILTSKFNVWSQVSGDIITKENQEGFFPARWAYQEILGLTDEEFQEMMNLRKEQLVEYEDKKTKSKDDEDESEDQIEAPGEEEGVIEEPQADEVEEEPQEASDETKEPEPEAEPEEEEAPEKDNKTVDLKKFPKP